MILMRKTGKWEEKKTGHTHFKLKGRLVSLATGQRADGRRSNKNAGRCSKHV